MISPVVFIVPPYQVMRLYGLLNTRLSVILASAAFAIPMVVWLLHGYFQRIPQDMEEAALVDGCNRLRARRSSLRAMNTLRVCSHDASSDVLPGRTANVAHPRRAGRRSRYRRGLHSHTAQHAPSGCDAHVAGRQAASTFKWQKSHAVSKPGESSRRSARWLTRSARSRSSTRSAVRSDRLSAKSPAARVPAPGQGDPPARCRNRRGQGRHPVLGPRLNQFFPGPVPHDNTVPRRAGARSRSASQRPPTILGQLPLRRCRRRYHQVGAEELDETRTVPRLDLPRAPQLVGLRRSTLGLAVTTRSAACARCRAADAG